MTSAELRVVNVNIWLVGLVLFAYINATPFGFVLFVITICYALYHIIDLTKNRTALSPIVYYGVANVWLTCSIVLFFAIGSWFGIITGIYAALVAAAFGYSEGEKNDV